VCNDLNVRHTYVGSTENFTIRKSAHKSKSNNPKYSHMKIYATMASNGGWSNWEMVLIETRGFETRLEAKQLERFHYEQLNREFALNMIFPQRDAAEYYDSNKDAFVVKNKNYREANKDAISTHNNVKHACVCGGQYTHSNLQRHMKTKIHLLYISQIKK